MGKPSASQSRARTIASGFGMKQCWGKVAYHTAESARDAARKYHQRPYECQVCRWWHLTSG